jgi:hypothetical protein
VIEFLTPIAKKEGDIIADTADIADLTANRSESQGLPRACLASNALNGMLRILPS